MNCIEQIHEELCKTRQCLDVPKLIICSFGFYNRLLAEVIRCHAFLGTFRYDEDYIGKASICGIRLIRTPDIEDGKDFEVIT